MSARSHMFPVSPVVPDKIFPLMAAFMSYFLRTHKSKDSSTYVKRAIPMISKLLFFFEPQYESDKEWRKRNPMVFRKALLRAKVTKSDGTTMKPMEQLELFAEIARQNGKEVQCILLENNSKNIIDKTDKKTSDALIVPVIKMDNGEFAATSTFNGFSFNFHSQNLRFNRQMPQKEMKVVPYEDIRNEFIQLLKSL